MTIARADILAYLQISLESLSTDTGQVTTDTTGGYKLPIDDALRRLGETNVASPSLADSFTEAAYAVAEYYALLRYLQKVTPRIDTNTVQSFAVGRSQIFLHIKDLLVIAADRCALLGYPVIGSDQPASGVNQTPSRTAGVATRAAW